MKGKISLWGNIVITIDVPDDYGDMDTLPRRLVGLIREAVSLGGEAKFEGDAVFINKMSEAMIKEANNEVPMS